MRTGIGVAAAVMAVMCLSPWISKLSEWAADVSAAPTDVVRTDVADIPFNYMDTVTMDSGITLPIEEFVTAEVFTAAAAFDCMIDVPFETMCAMAVCSRTCAEMAMNTDGVLLSAEHPLLTANSGNMAEMAAMAASATEGIILSVPAPMHMISPDDEAAPQIRHFTAAELEARLFCSGIDILPFDGADCSCSDGAVRICGAEVAAADFARMFSLRSTVFELESSVDGCDVTVRGWGDWADQAPRGMSIWGAAKMAEEGHSWQEILEYYFPGSEKITRQKGDG